MLETFFIVLIVLQVKVVKDSWQGLRWPEVLLEYFLAGSKDVLRKS